MTTIIKKTLAEMALLVVLGLTCFCVVACGDEEKKLKVEDSAPPVISIVKVYDITGTSAHIRWETDEPAKSQVMWGLTDSLVGTKVIIHKEFTTTSNFKITDLSPSTLYYYWTASVDAKNNWNVPKPSTFTTPAE